MPEHRPASKLARMTSRSAEVLREIALRSGRRRVDLLHEAVGLLVDQQYPDLSGKLRGTKETQRS